jgi:hypothetical protein
VLRATPDRLRARNTPTTRMPPKKEVVPTRKSSRLTHESDSDSEGDNVRRKAMLRWLFFRSIEFDCLIFSRAPNHLNRMFMLSLANILRKTFFGFPRLLCEGCFQTLPMLPDFTAIATLDIPVTYLCVCITLITRFYRFLILPSRNHDDSPRFLSLSVLPPRSGPSLNPTRK